MVTVRTTSQARPELGTDHPYNPPLLHQNLIFSHIIYSTTTTNKNIFKYPNSIYIKSISEFLEHNTGTNREICKILSDNTHDFSLGTEIVVGS